MAYVIKTITQNQHFVLYDRLSHTVFFCFHDIWLGELSKH